MLILMQTDTAIGMIQRSSASILNMMSNSSQIVRDRFASMLGMSHNGSRDLYAVFGYPKVLDVAALHALYKRNAIANRIVRAYPQATWRDCPIVGDEDGTSTDKNEKGYSPFAEAVTDLFESTNLLKYVERADRLAGRGRYSVLLLGFADDKDFSRPVNKAAKLMYVQPYGDLRATIGGWVTDPTDPRYGKPISYNIIQGGDTDASGSAPQKSMKVHWTRIIHIAEFCDEDDVYGMPRLQPIYNNLMDMEKVLGGSAETFWLCANRGIHFSADKEMQFGDTERTALLAAADKVAHSFERSIVTRGVTAEVLQSESPDPAPNVDKLMDVIAGGCGIPKRILLGAEAGSLASSQDENNWAQRVNERRVNFATPAILRPLLTRLIETGNLIEPNGKWTITWPTGESLGEVVEVDTKSKRLAMAVSYVSTPGMDLLIPPKQFGADFLDMDLDLEALPDDPELDSDVPEEEIEPNALPDDKTGYHTHMAPKSMYVCRKVLNARAILKWAKSQGMSDLVFADEMHVTIMYSVKAVDWMKAESMWTEEDDGTMTIAPGGPRSVEAFGDDAVVLEFSCADLRWRHEHLKSIGAVHGHADYKPHITIGRGYIPEDIRPYTGVIVLGPEIFSEIEVD
jgi:hypothetical protein